MSTLAIIFLISYVVWTVFVIEDAFDHTNKDFKLYTVLWILLHIIVIVWGIFYLALN